MLGSHIAGPRAGDGDGFLHPRAAGTSWPEKQTLSGASSVAFPGKDDFILQVHVAVVMASVSLSASCFLLPGK